MSNHPLLERVLLHLFRLSAPAGRPPAGRFVRPFSPSSRGPLTSASRPSPAPERVTHAALAAAVGLPEARLGEALAVLERASLVVAGGPRLTLAGLAVAAALRAGAGQPVARRSNGPRRRGGVEALPVAESPRVGTEPSRPVPFAGIGRDTIPSAA